MTASIYIHVPFCVSKCDYCDFYSIPVGLTHDSHCDSLFDAYVNRILNGVKVLSEKFHPENIPSIYIGGGTPSVLGPVHIQRLLSGLQTLLPTPHELTVEVNPESASEDFLLACRNTGVNRISMGVQSLYEPSRAAVHRTGAITGRAIEEKLALVSGIFPGAYSIDLITGLPLQTLTVIRSDIDRVLAFKPGHISLYALTVEPGTPLAAARQKLVEPDKADALWLCGRDRLLEAGYEQYEVSNFSMPGKRCLHNIRYWRMENWLGLGPGASGTVFDGEWGKKYEDAAACRFSVSPDVEKWLANPDSCVQEELIDVKTAMKETFLMGFRYIDGPDPELFHKRFGKNIADVIPKTLQKWKNSGCMAPDYSAMNREGLLLLDRFLIDAFDEIDS